MTRTRILVIDDSLTIRAMIEEILTPDRGCEVVGVAATPEVARRLIEECYPDVIMLDLVLPGVEGLSLLDELAGGARMPVVVVSSRTRPGTEVEAEVLAHGAYAAFDKARLVADGGKLSMTLKRAAVRFRRWRARQLATLNS
jgi:chemotaxis response regulator CheB